MIRVHTSDGLTTKLDLRDDRQARDFLRRLADPTFQGSVTAVTAYTQTYNANGRPSEIQYSLTRPEGFRDVAFDAEVVLPDPARRNKGGERIVVVADEVRVTVMIHKEQNAARISVLKAGRQRYNPRLRG